MHPWRMSKCEFQSAKCDRRPYKKFETIADLFASANHYSECSLREKNIADGRFTHLLTSKLPDASMREMAKLALAAKEIKVAGAVDTCLLNCSSTDKESQ